MTSLVENFYCKCKDACHQLINLPEAPQKVAQGIALGVAFDFLPLPFISIPLAYLIARLKSRARGRFSCFILPMAS